MVNPYKLQLIREFIDAMDQYTDARCDYLHECRRGNEWRSSSEIERTSTALEQAIVKLIEG